MNESNKKLLDSFEIPECCRCGSTLVNRVSTKNLQRIYYCQPCSCYTVYPENETKQAS